MGELIGGLSEPRLTLLRNQADMRAKAALAAGKPNCAENAAVSAGVYQEELDRRASRVDPQARANLFALGVAAVSDEEPACHMGERSALFALGAGAILSPTGI